MLVLYKTANYYNFYNGLNYFVIHENCEKEYDLAMILHVILLQDWVCKPIMVGFDSEFVRHKCIWIYIVVLSTWIAEVERDFKWWWVSEKKIVPKDYIKNTR